MVRVFLIGLGALVLGALMWASVAADYAAGFEAAWWVPLVFLAFPAFMAFAVWRGWGDR